MCDDTPGNSVCEDLPGSSVCDSPSRSWFSISPDSSSTLSPLYGRSFSTRAALVRWSRRYAISAIIAPSSTASETPTPIPILAASSSPPAFSFLLVIIVMLAVELAVFVAVSVLTGAVPPWIVAVSLLIVVFSVLV